MTGPGDDMRRIRRLPSPCVWALGDYHRFAKELVWEVGPVVVDACGIGPGQHVLDVAAGTGNVAIRAAEAGATVVASDITPENFAAGRRRGERARRRTRMGSKPTPQGSRSPTASSTPSSLFARSSARRGGAAARCCGCAGGVARSGWRIHADGLRRFLRRLAPTRRRRRRERCRRSGGSEGRARAVRRPGRSLQLTRRDKSRTSRAARLLRLLQANVRAGRRNLREPRRRAGARRRAGRDSWIRRALEPGRERRSGRVRLRVPARGRAQGGERLRSAPAAARRGAGSARARPRRRRRSRRDQPRQGQARDDAVDAPQDSTRKRLAPASTR